MNKNELILEASEKCGVTKKDTDKVLAALIETIIERVKDDEKVQIMGFGTFERRSRNERTGKDPRTGKEILIPACNVPAFKAGKGFKDAVSGK